MFIFKVLMIILTHVTQNEKIGGMRDFEKTIYLKIAVILN